MKVGLTLGKFAPLHRGHQYMIETALAETDRVIVVIYDAPETTLVPLPVRANWLRQLYPSIEVLEAWDGPTETGYTPEIMAAQEGYMLRLLDGRQVTHFYSSERYGEHMSRALGAVDRRVDPERVRFPVSGTLVRQDPYAWRRFLDPVVYRDLVTNVLFLGAPSTGKSTLAERLAAEYQTVFMPEYGREYWDRHQVNGRLTPTQLVELAEGHLEREEQQLQEARQYLFTDTNAITTYMFALHYHGTADPRLAELARLATTRYDLVFLCGDEIPFDPTDRSGGVQGRQVFQRQIAADLLARRIPFIPVSGSLEQRVARVKAVLQRYEKYMSPGELL